MAEKVPKFVKRYKTSDWRGLETPNKINTKKSTPRHITV